MELRRKRATSVPSVHVLLRISLAINCILLLIIFYLNLGTDVIVNKNTDNLNVIETSWHGGHPAENRSGSCWCGKHDGYCMCTPNLAIDLIITSSSSSSSSSSSGIINKSKVPTVDDYIWLVRRKDTNQLATMGGFVDVNETVEDAVKRELMEEMALTLHTNVPPKLVGLYSDPRRDNRRRTASAVFAVHLPHIQHPHAGDDAKEVVQIPISSIEDHDYFADHRTILLDYRATLIGDIIKDSTEGDFAADIQRSTCGQFQNSLH